MPPSARERQLARQRAARRAAREAELRRRRRRRWAVVGSVVAVLLVVGGAILLIGLTSDNKKKPAPPATASGCGYTAGGAAGPAAKPASLPPAEPDRTGKYVANITTNRGAVQVNLLTSAAPCTVGSFRSLASSGYFDNTPCHRLVAQPSFGVLQCGDPSGTGQGGPGYTFKDENLAGASYPRGTLAMANSGPDTNGSQFFLVFRDSQLPPSYTPFGTITKGLDVLDKIAAGGVQSPSGDGAPKQPVTLQKVTVAAS